MSEQECICTFRAETFRRTLTDSDPPDQIEGMPIDVLNDDGEVQRLVRLDGEWKRFRSG